MLSRAVHRSSSAAKLVSSVASSRQTLLSRSSLWSSRTNVRMYGSSLEGLAEARPGSYVVPPPGAAKPLNILFLTNAHNSMSQRAYLELTYRCGHNVSVELAISEDQMLDAVATHAPDVIVCPFLTKRVPEAIWRNPDVPCLVVHPGIHGDRGISAIDWALLNKEPEWGVTVLQAVDEMDAGDIWATHNFAVPDGADGCGTTKSALYQNQCVEAGITGLREALVKFQTGVAPIPLDYSDPAVKGTLMPNMKQADRKVDFDADAGAVARVLRVSDTTPGVSTKLANGQSVFLFGATVDDAHVDGVAPGTITGHRDGAVRMQCGRGSVWVSHMRAKGKGNYKLPSTSVVSPDTLASAPQLAAPSLVIPHGHRPATFQEVWATVDNGVAYVHFNFYNGAMSTPQCEQLTAALKEIRARSDVHVVTLMGGDNFFSNGIHLNTIEAAADPAAESWANINAINDVVKEVFSMTDKVTVSAVGGNAGAGGVMQALAADFVWTHGNVVLNPHYKSMGLFGSEYWTYFLPRRVGSAMATKLTESMQPLLGEQAAAIGMVDRVLCDSKAQFRSKVEKAASDLRWDSEQMDAVLSYKALTQNEGWTRQVEAHRTQELEEMKRCFVSAEYIDARVGFVHKHAATETPAHLKHPVAVVPPAHRLDIQGVLEPLVAAAEAEAETGVLAGTASFVDRSAGMPTMPEPTVQPVVPGGGMTVPSGGGSTVGA